MIIERDLIAEPTNVRFGADEDEHGARFERVALTCVIVLDNDSLEHPVPHDLAHLGAVVDLDAGVPLELVDQVARHVLLEIIAADNQVNLGCVLGKK